MAPWTCGHCGRSFDRGGGWHACGRRSGVGEHFLDRPAWMRAAFDRVVAAAGDGVEVYAVQGGVRLRDGAVFATVVPLAGRLRVVVVLDHVSAHPRVARRERVSANRVSHEFDLVDPDELDADVLDHVRAARGLRAGSG